MRRTKQGINYTDYHSVFGGLRQGARGLRYVLIATALSCSNDFAVEPPVHDMPAQAPSVVPAAPVNEVATPMHAETATPTATSNSQTPESAGAAERAATPAKAA